MRFVFGNLNHALKVLQHFSRIIARPFSQNVSHKINLISAFVLLLGIVVSFYLVGIIGPSKPPILPGEIDLSGPWKLHLKDKPEFASSSFDDSSWCYSGVPDPALGKLNPHNTSCESFFYPAEEMRGQTYWYRKWVDIPENVSWNEPSLFLGAIKHKAWIYWDGELIGISNFKDGTGMTTVLLENHQVTAGRHLLAIRVASLNTRYPGLFHAYPRRVTLGEVDGNVSQHHTITNQRYVVPAIVLFVQTTGLLLTLLLLSLGKGAGTDFFWLAVYFFGTAVAGTEKIAPTEYQGIILRISIAVSSFGVFGYSLQYHRWIGAQIHIVSRALLALMTCAVIFYVYQITTSNFFGPVTTRVTLAIALVPFLAFVVSLVATAKDWSIGKEKMRICYTSIFSILIIGSLHLLNVVGGFFMAYSPVIIAHPAFKAGLSVSLIATLIYQYTQQERTLAFFGRFIRPGLRDLLHEKMAGSNQFDEKMFRARKIAIMKIDIVGHTETTFQMPYGIKRLFQDTWFTVIDDVVSARVFMDKNVGDGSIYCFSEHHKDGSCGSALNAALAIRDEAVARFDQEFLYRLEEFLSVTEELREPAASFFSSYMARTGTDFFHRKTKVRIALVYGYVDEGLWGLSSQSHYDVQGDLVSLAARVESKAKENEILMDEGFVQAAEESLRDQKISPRLETLKGMGEVKVFAIEAKNKLSSAA